MKETTLSTLLKISAILWIIWGLVHMLAGVMTISNIVNGDTSASVAAIADGVDPALVTMDYPAAAGAILCQHGFNLLWGGLVTVLCAFFIWKKNKNAIFLAAIVGGLLDVGYFLFMDLGGYVKFVPGTVMTLISASAIILSFYAYFKGKNMGTARS
ncbi:MAG: hypothetical protein AAGG75_28610 [Bacteroidota bacterium]